MLQKILQSVIDAHWNKTEKHKNMLEYEHYHRQQHHTIPGMHLQNAA